MNKYKLYTFIYNYLLLYVVLKKKNCMSLPDCGELTVFSSWNGDKGGVRLK